MSKAVLAGTGRRQRYHGTSQRAPSKANFAIRELPPAGLGLKASLQQLKGAASSLKAQGRRHHADEDFIGLVSDWEQGPSVLPLPSPGPSPSQAVAQTHRLNEGVLHSAYCACVASYLQQWATSLHMCLNQELWTLIQV